jgi:hypothetical protein
MFIFPLLLLLLLLLLLFADIATLDMVDDFLEGGGVI